MFTKMNNLQKQIDIVTDIIFLEWQKVQLDDGRYWQAQKINRFAKAVKNNVSKQFKEARIGHWQNWYRDNAADDWNRIKSK